MTTHPYWGRVVEEENYGVFSMSTTDKVIKGFDDDARRAKAWLIENHADDLKGAALSEKNGKPCVVAFLKRDSAHDMPTNKYGVQIVYE